MVLCFISAALLVCGLLFYRGNIIIIVLISIVAILLLLQAILMAAVKMGPGLFGTLNIIEAAILQIILLAACIFNLSMNYADIIYAPPGIGTLTTQALLWLAYTIFAIILCSVLHKRVSLKVLTILPGSVSVLLSLVSVMTIAFYRDTQNKETIWFVFAAEALIIIAGCIYFGTMPSNLRERR